jgi:ferrous iron transport protein A
MPSLDELSPGQRGRISALAGNDSLVQRLMEMGVFEGEEIEVVALAPLGDPLEVRLGDSRLSLRRAEASRIQIILS